MQRYNVRVTQGLWTCIILPKYISVFSFTMAVVTVLQVQREAAASDYLASTAALAEWFTSHCSALVYCVQKIHQCEHQSATETPLRAQSIHLHAVQPWPMLGCLKNMTCTMLCAHTCAVCMCTCFWFLCVTQCITIIIITATHNNMINLHYFYKQGRTKTW